jgi:hypothetical protein
MLRLNPGFANFSCILLGSQVIMQVLKRTRQQKSHLALHTNDP